MHKRESERKKTLIRATPAKAGPLVEPIFVEYNHSKCTIHDTRCQTSEIVCNKRAKVTPEGREEEKAFSKCFCCFGHQQTMFSFLSTVVLSNLSFHSSLILAQGRAKFSFCGPV